MVSIVVNNLLGIFLSFGILGLGLGSKFENPWTLIDPPEKGVYVKKHLPCNRSAFFYIVGCISFILVIIQLIRTMH